MKINAILNTLLALSLMFASMMVQAHTEIYFLRHAEVDMSNPDKPLLESGKQRAIALAKHFQGKEITHLFVTFFERNKETGLPLAKSKNIELIQIPKPGSQHEGKEVTNRSKGKIATKPMLKSIKSLPDGSVAVVIANSGNLFPIMSKYGVTQIPCPSKKCFPKKEFDNIWKVTNTKGVITMSKTRYGN
jgi:hypothetical protein